MDVSLLFWVGGIVLVVVIVGVLFWVWTSSEARGGRGGDD